MVTWAKNLGLTSLSSSCLLKGQFYSMNTTARNASCLCVLPCVIMSPLAVSIWVTICHPSGGYACEGDERLEDISKEGSLKTGSSDKDYVAEPKGVIFTLVALGQQRQSKSSCFLCPLCSEINCWQYLRQLLYLKRAHKVLFSGLPTLKYSIGRIERRLLADMV